ncbi:hypothetical protein F383_28494 [Gossypium arboreum]|uniref:Uncharacterized protein n=1 Tax=Gossypium arboreum TaxID=29729 RepID=A0A0B0MYW4_GOSAR|nr:hypothetical protein F383_28494 [Gossypium arboreum]
MMISSVTKRARVGGRRRSHHTIKLMFKIEHTGRDMGMCLSRVRDTAPDMGMYPGRVKVSPIL